MRYKNIYTYLLIVLVSLMYFRCNEELDPVITELDVDRVFSPVGLEARIRNQTTIELTWNLRDDAAQYVVEFSEDSLQFNNIIRTLTVTPDELPVQEAFQGETVYSARVKGVSSDGLGDSKWSAVAIKTGAEQLFLSSEPGDIRSTQAILRWTAGSEVTHLVINPGATERLLSPDEIAAGVATVTDLIGETTYSVLLKNDAKTRGNKEFTTLMDLGDALPIYPEDDIVAKLDGAADGDKFVVFPGEYNLGSYSVTKSVSLSGFDPVDRPVIYGQFVCGATVATMELNYLDIRGNGDATVLGQFFNTASGCNLTTLTINECKVGEYTNNFIYNNASGVFGTITVKGSYVYNIPGGGGDGIDFRNGTIGSLTVENSTFANGFRTFLRMQAQCNTVFRSNTFYRVASNDNSNNHGLFRASGGGTFEVTSCLFVETGVQTNPTGTLGNFCRQASNMVPSPVYTNNNIFNCYNIFTGLYTSAAEVSATEVDPGFVDAVNGNFTVTSQDIKDDQIGDPRWLQ